jgi:aspartate/methionine/tyrosine aminotransferase
VKTQPWHRNQATNRLFGQLPANPLPVVGDSTRWTAPCPGARLDADPLAELRGVFERADDPGDADTMLRLFVGQVESTAPPLGGRRLDQRLWSRSRPRRALSTRELLGQRTAPRLLKSIFDFYFRDDLYGHWADGGPIVLSSGSFDETVFGLPESLKACIRFALDRNWYGYSDSLGRTSARSALAALETARSGGTLPLGPEHLAVTLGGTASVASIVDMLASASPADDRIALCGAPNYPPLVAAVARRMPVRMVTTPTVDGHTDISELIVQVRAGARLVLLQTITNPTGLRVSESQLAELIAAAPPDCHIVLDECHDSFGPAVELTRARLAPNVVSVRSISKKWGAPGLKAGWLVAGTGFIDEFYVHASTTYGGPPSLFYLLLEMFGLFEAARLDGGLDADELVATLSEEYELEASLLRAGFADYVAASDRMREEVLRCRAFTLDRLDAAGVPVVAPAYSINVLARLGDGPSYATYRRLVSEVGVSVYPGLLCFADGPGHVRISPCVPPAVLDDALGRITKWTLENA